MKKRIISMLLSFAMLLSLSVPSFASGDRETADDGKSTVEMYNGTLYYSVHTDEIVYCSQLSQEGTMVFSYALPDEGIIYQSEPIELNLAGRLRESASSTEYLEAVNQEILNHLDGYAVSPVIRLQDQADNMRAARANASSAMLKQVEYNFGADYKNTLVASKKYTHDKDYYLYIYGSQSTYQMNYSTVDFAVGTAVSTIQVFFDVFKMDFTIQWFVGLVGDVIDYVGNVEKLIVSVTGEVGVFSRNRIKQVTVPSYTNEVIYSASSVLNQAFLCANGKWGIRNSEGTYTQPIYNDNNQIFSTAWTRFVTNWLN